MIYFFLIVKLDTSKKNLSVYTSNCVKYTIECFKLNSYIGFGRNQINNEVESHKKSKSCETAPLNKVSTSKYKGTFLTSNILLIIKHNQILYIVFYSTKCYFYLA